ncbi:MAG: PspC domain-containing protein [Bacteroidaceae bacterium]|nr:PspC domain-containing protein [Bacteroidaceae bacterium]
MGKLYRSNERVLAGVCAGIAEWAGLEAKLVRIIWLVGLLFGGFSIVLYVVLWIIMPQKSVAKSYSDRMNEKLGRK